MPKIKINEIDGKPATSSVWLADGEKLLAGDTADVDDVGPYQPLIDRGILVKTAGRPKSASATDPD